MAWNPKKEENVFKVLVAGVVTIIGAVIYGKKHKPKDLERSDK